LVDVSPEDLARRCLRGEYPSREIRDADVESWATSNLLLPIADALERREADFRERLTPVAVDRLHRLRRAAAASEAGERHAIREVLTRLDEVGVTPLLLKGVALGYTVYRAPWLRARSDVDLLIAPGSMERAGLALTGLGFVAAREVCHPLITRQRHFTRESGFRVAIDVHESLVNPLVLRTLPCYDVLNERSQPVPSLAPGARALGTADALLHALVHRVAHHNSSADLLWLYDLHLLADRMGGRDWNLFVNTATTARVCRVAVDGLRLLSSVLHTDVPDFVLRQLAEARGEPSAALLGGTLTEWRLQWINWRSLRGARLRLAFVRAHLMPPPSELPFGAEPAWHLPSNYVVRAVRGARKWLAPISRSR
jgi:hypothetical protein